MDRYGTLQLFTISAISCPVMFLSFPLLPYFQDFVPTWVLMLLVQVCLVLKVPPPRKVDVRLPGKGNSNSHGARPVRVIITMM